MLLGEFLELLAQLGILGRPLRCVAKTGDRDLCQPASVALTHLGKPSADAFYIRPCHPELRRRAYEL